MSITVIVDIYLKCKYSAEQKRHETAVELEPENLEEHTRQFPLHRIEEESEHIEGSLINSSSGCGPTHFDRERNIIPRSISQQV